MGLLGEELPAEDFADGEDTRIVIHSIGLAAEDFSQVES